MKIIVTRIERGYRAIMEGKTDWGTGDTPAEAIGQLLLILQTWPELNIEIRIVS